jgi:uncharacterized membrane protein YeaQ/YmgE (transglycosylase-associated protein family)
LGERGVDLDRLWRLGRGVGPSGSTLVLGIVGSALGLVALSFLFSDRQINPISPLGLLAGTAGAFFLLILYRVVYACCPKREEGPGE